MAEIEKFKKSNPSGFRYRVTWLDQADKPKVRLFKSRVPAERFSVEIEVRLLEEMLSTMR